MSAASETEQISTASATKRARTSWKKTVSFIGNPSKRRRFDADNIRQLRSKVQEWHVKTKAPIACFVFYSSRVNFITSPDLRGMAQNQEIQQLISSYICDNVAPQHELDAMFSDEETEVEIPFNWKRNNVAYLRNLVQDIITHKGKRPPHWGIDSKKPFWWPAGTEFVNPNNNRKEGRPKRDGLIGIIQAFIESRTTESIADEDADDQPDEDIDAVCSKINAMMTCEEGESVLQSITSMSLSQLNLASERIAQKSSEVCCSLPQVPILEESVMIWRRYEMPLEVREMSLDPVAISCNRDGIFKVTSKLLFGDERHWQLLKIGSIATCVREKDVIIKKFHEKSLSLENENFFEHLQRNILDPSEHDALDSLKDIVFVALSLCRFICRPVTLFFKHGADKVELNFDNQSIDTKLYFLIDGQSNSILSLALPCHDNLSDGRVTCSAKIRCRLGRFTEPTVTCRHCWGRYHPYCIAEESPDDDCGCSEIPEASEGLKAFNDIKRFKELFALCTTELKELVQQLCEGSPSCRKNRKANIRHQLNCLIGGVSMDVHYYLVDELASWFEKMPAIEKIQRGPDFFCHVIVPEVLIFLVSKETATTRLCAERVARRVLGEA